MHLHIFFVFLVFTFFLKGQNLVPNSSFEEMSERGCPTGMGQADHVKDWESSSLASPDYFCSCGPKKYAGIKVPLNFTGYQPARSGNCYMGLICYSEGVSYKEYIEVELAEKLRKHKKYCLSFYYSLSDFSVHKVSSLGIALVKKKTAARNMLPIKKGAISKKIINDTLGWNKFSIVYTANGDEKYLNIGSFNNDHSRASPKKEPKQFNRFTYNLKPFAYYYIEDVCLTEMKEDSVCNCGEPLQLEEKRDTVPVVKRDSLKVMSTVFTFRELTFETNKSLIQPVSFRELDSLAGYLKEHPEYAITLAGHTDNTGKETDNQKLSEARAKAVADYLINKGVDASHIESKGYGSSKPVVVNDTEEHKLANRRVEFVLRKK